MKIKTIYQTLDTIAPFSSASSWDNSGLLAGDMEKEVTTVLCALDCTDEVIQEADEVGAGLIITHHPLLFHPLSAITTGDPVGRKLIRLIQLDIGLIASHTCLDKASGGTSDVLADLLGLTETAPLFEDPQDENFGLGKYGTFSTPLSLQSLLTMLSERLALESLHYMGNLQAEISRAALCTGSCSGRDFIQQAVKKDCHVYITGDVTFHNAQWARELNICLIDATHYASENIVIPELCRKLSSLISGVQFIPSQWNGQMLCPFSPHQKLATKSD